MEIIFELIFGVVIEAVLGVAGEILVELGLNPFADRLSGRAWKRVLTGALYILFGFLLGWFSLTIFPKFDFANNMIPVIYFVVSPIIAGLALCAVNWLLHRDIDNRIGFFQLQKFVYGAMFVLTFSSTRALFG
jgi:hypothetical protein